MGFVSSVFGGGKGGGGGGGSNVDPFEVARAQAEYNRGNITTPFGNLLREGQHGRDARIQLSPNQQQVVDTLLQWNNALPGYVSDYLGGQYFRPGQFTGTDAADAAFEAAMNRINPEFDRRQSALQDQLVQSGNPAVGGDLAPGAVSELDVLNRARNDAMTQAALQAQIRGEESALQDAQRRILERGQVFSELGGTQGLLGNAVSAFGGGQLLGQGISPIDITGAFNAATQSQLARGQQQSGKNALLGALGSAVIGAF